MFYFDEFDGKKVLKTNILEGLNHFFTTRECPIKGSEETYKQGLKLNRLVSPTQTHSCTVQKLDPILYEYPNTDGLVFNEESCGVFLNFADCVPLIFFDTSSKVAAVTHAGWKGTATRIAVETVYQMTKHYHSLPEDIHVAIGPAISLCCYEVSEEVKDTLLATVKNTDNLFLENKVDLKQINARQLEETGVKNIDICPYCTSCNNDLFFSYRKENGTPLRHNAIAWFD